MKISLDHIPAENRQQILELVEIIKEVAPAMIILHGSFAAGPNSWNCRQYGGSG